ncbi:MAG: glutamate-cysteine ligase family protein [bacterium]|nr:glutamate-cysteine ligase family protein [bacterium]
MKLFDKITLGYEWETALLTEGYHIQSKEVLDSVVRKMCSKFPYSRTGPDGMWRIGEVIFEIRSGILESFNEHVKKTNEMYNSVLDICKEKNMHFYPSSAFEIYGRAFGLHVHIGTITDVSLANQVANKFSKYVPAFIALSCNSPVTKIKSGDFKSYRMSDNADWCSMPRRIVNPDYLYFVWGDDTCVKFQYKPTIELRCGDSASSLRFMIEYAAFSGLSILGFAETERNFSVSKSEYLENMINRIQATKFGLQSEFTVNGKATTPSELLLELFDRTRNVFSKFGCSKNDFKLILQMIKKKQTQADFKAEIFSHLPDQYAYTAEMVRIMKNKSFFEEYLENAPELETLKPINIDDFILEQIYIRSELAEIYDKVHLPTNYLVDRLDQLVSKGKLKKRMVPEKGFVYERR